MYKHTWFFFQCLKIAEGVIKAMVGCTLKVLHSLLVINKYVFRDSTAVVKTINEKEIYY